MPAKSPEALARKRQRRAEKNRRKAAKQAVSIDRTVVLSSRKITARRMMPKIGDLSKSELREMIAAAAANTARL